MSDFTRIYGTQHPQTTSTSQTPSDQQLEQRPTECLLYGYATRASEWKVLTKFESVVTPGFICEDYARQDPSLAQNTNSPMAFQRAAVVVRQNLSKEAVEKSRKYKGGNHWIKVTFDSYEAADRACYFSPLEIDGCSVYCEMWNGSGPSNDVPIPKGMDSAGSLISQQRARTVGVAGGKASAVAGFEQAISGTLPRSHTLPDVQYGQPGARDDLDIASSTASSATATAVLPTSPGSLQPPQNGLRSRSQPNLPSQVDAANALQKNSQFMSRAPAIKKAALRPVSEALPPRQSFVERLLRSLPIVNYLLGLNVPPATDKEGRKTGGGGLIGEGPVIKEDGSWDEQSNGWYWRLWHNIDRLVGSDLCGLKED